MTRTQVTFQDVLWALRNGLVWILLTTAIGALGLHFGTKWLVTPVYSARVTVAVFADYRDGSAVSSSQLNNDASIANTYSLLLTSQPVLNAVSDALDNKIPAAALAGMIGAVRVEESQLLEVSVRSTDPALATEIANTILDVAPDVLNDLARGGEMISINRAAGAGKVSPNLRNNTVYGGLIGLILSCAVIIIITMTDTTIWREEDLEEAYNIPVFGSVPSMSIISSATKHKSGR